MKTKIILVAIATILSFCSCEKESPNNELHGKYELVKMVPESGVYSKTIQISRIDFDVKIYSDDKNGGRAYDWLVDGIQLKVGNQKEFEKPNFINPYQTYIYNVDENSLTLMYNDTIEIYERV